MEKGYRLIEPSGLSDIMANVKHHPIAVALLHWLIEELHDQMKNRLDGIELEVIQVNYHGAYPCLGAHYVRSHRVDDDQLEKLIAMIANRLLDGHAVSRFTGFLARTDVDWKAVTERIMTPIPPVR